MNLGNLVRIAHAFDASFFFSIAPRLNLSRANSDTSNAEGVLPFYSYDHPSDFRLPLDIWGVELAPEARVGYRYDLLGSPVKLKAGFLSTGGLGTVGNTMQFVGPDPDQGNTILGLGIGASTDTWHLGGQYDWVRGSNGSTTQVGIITLLARI